MLSFLLHWVLSALAVMFVAWAIPGISVVSFWSALFAAVIIGFVNGFIKPIAMFLTFPINLITLGLFTLVINAFMLILVSKIVPGFKVDGFWAAFWGAILLSIVSTFLGSLNI
ncbi:MAG: phage holin family protein [Candidatus Gastranaerophilales bacterium]|nr:phage holin family protein [Candidatus Gastranaerophilales bacterium]